MHQPLEDEIHGVDHVRSRAEVHRQFDALAIVSRRIFGVFLHEERRIGEAEAIDRLLDIAHDEQILAVRNRLHDRLLHFVRILILVDHHGAVFFAERVCDRLVGEDLQCEMLHVVEVDQALVSLGGGIRFGEGERHFDERLDRRSHRAEIFKQSLGRCKEKIGFEFRNARFIFVAECFDLIFCHGIDAFQIQPHERSRIDHFIQSPPIDLKRTLEIVEQLGVVHDTRRNRLRQQRLHDRTLGDGGVELELDLLMRLVIPTRLLDRCVVGNVEVGRERFQPRDRIGMALRGVTEIDHELVQCRIAALTAAELVGKSLKSLPRGIVGSGVMIFKHLLDDLLLEDV